MKASITKDDFQNVFQSDSLSFTSLFAGACGTLASALLKANPEFDPLENYIFSRDDGQSFVAHFLVERPPYRTTIG
jgi:hypothetical protein